MATYNGERFIKEQLTSILSQLQPEDEIIVSDDSSTDSTLDIISSFNDSRIKIFNNENTRGVNSNFENAIRHSNGDIIFLSDQDNVWAADKIKLCLKEIGTSDCVVHDCSITDENLRIVNNSLFSTINAREGLLHNIFRNGFTGCCMCFRKELINSILPIPSSKSYYYDQWIGLRAELKGKTKFIKTPLTKFRRHESNISSASSVSHLSFFKKIHYRVLLVVNLFLFDYKQSYK
ncbi:MAG: glycosyltransferase family 2 protein [Muribaculaceae bacterium]|nr:glycosyltransferase family 2 protein [Muribaculaceae bacterium]MDE6753116.1 glycosyltransferase family 2 protein [Muribaculaceae bacterium]